LTERDQKQVNFEDMSTALQSVVLERERLLYPGKNLGNHTSGMNISEFMTDKMADAGRARSERVIRLESKIKEV
jgi:sorting nexin-4